MDLRFLKYQIYICYLTLALTALLWPFFKHPFLFSLIFTAVYHEYWDQIAGRKIWNLITDYIWFYWPDHEQISTLNNADLILTVIRSIYPKCLIILLIAALWPFTEHPIVIGISVDLFFSGWDIRLRTFIDDHFEFKGFSWF